MKNIKSICHTFTQNEINKQQVLFTNHQTTKNIIKNIFIVNNGDAISSVNCYINNDEQYPLVVSGQKIKPHDRIVVCKKSIVLKPNDNIIVISDSLDVNITIMFVEED